MRNILFILTIYLSIFSHFVQPAPSAALGYTPKYPADFRHFDYVNPSAPKSGELILSGTGNFDNVNPFLLKGLAPIGASYLVFETLMEKSEDEPLSFYGLLAEDIELAEDKLSVTFKLNEDARFSDGSEVTAEDVKFSFETLKTDEAAHPQYRIYWNDIESAEILDKYTVRFHFAKENPELFLIAAEFPIFSKTVMGDKSLKDFVTESLTASGPYTIESFKAGKIITYKRNPHYWGERLSTRRGMFNFDRIIVKYYQDTNVTVEAFKAGEFDFMAVYHSKKWARDFEGPHFKSGEIKKEEFINQNNQGMQAFVFNMRRPIFQDKRVRKAINLAYDFEWANKNLFYDQYSRCDSYFSNSELAARGLPEGKELKLLKELSKKFEGQVPDEVFTREWKPITTEAPHSLRKNLIKAQALLKEAGWRLKDGILEKDGQKLEFSVMLWQNGFERILAPFARNLKKLGINVEYRVVDVALYQQRQETFNFDMTVTVFEQSQSPGNELMNTWYSSSADREGSQNLMGLRNPVVDALIEKIIYAKDRDALVTATHALDRVMLNGYYLVPNWFIGYHRAAYWDKFGKPENLPLYFDATRWAMKMWWHKEETMAQ